MKKLLSILSLACAAIYGGDCLAITATKEYVDRRDATLISKPATTVPAGYVLVKGAASNETAWVENTGAGMSSNQVVSIASSAAVTNAGAVASSKAYADGTFAPKVAGGYLPLSAGSSHKINSQLYFNYWKSGGFVLPSNIPGENLLELNGEMASFEFYGHEYDSGFSPFSLNFMTPYYRERYSVELTPRVTYDVEIGGDILDAFVFKRRRYMNSYESVLMPDNSPVVTSNMLNGVLTPALAQKADRAVPSASGNFAALTAQGNLADSGKKASDFATPQIVTNIVTNVVSQAYIRQRLGVYLYVGPDNGIYVHVE